MSEENPVFKVFAILSGFVLLVLLCGIYVLMLGGQQVWSAWSSGPPRTSLERVGIILQLLAGLSVSIDLFGEERLLRWGASLRELYADVKGMRPLSWIFERPTPGRMLSLWGLYALWIVAILYLWLNLGVVQTGLSCFVFAVLAFGGFALTPYMTLTIVRVARAILAVCLRLLPIRRLFTIVTLPLFVVGSLLLLAATFL